MEDAPRTVDLEAHLEDIGSGWRRTPPILLRGWTTDEDGPMADRVSDPTRPGEYVYGPASVVLEIGPDGGHRLIVR